MTELEWLSATDPRSMIGPPHNPLSERKLRLFACGCCRRVWHLLDAISRQAVLLAEQHADGINTAALGIFRHGNYVSDREGVTKAAFAATELTCGLYPFWECAVEAACQTACFARDEVAERLAQAALFRCVAGNPFRPVAIDPAWRTFTVSSLAQAIYDDRTFDRLPILADALEDAGCDSADILNHCRQPGEHVRGCWCVDLLLDRR